MGKLSLYYSYQASINIRPFTEICLKTISAIFEVIVFTASRKEYADAMIDKIDPDKKYIHHRVYRDSCVFTGGLYIKDLRVLNRDLKNIVIIDNAVISFGFQLENGIPILPFYDDFKDDCLYKIAVYLKYLSSVEDMRNANNDKFCLLELRDSQFCQFLDYYLSDEEEDGGDSSNCDSPFKNAVPLIKLSKLGDAIDDMHPGTPSRKMSLTKKSEKEISDNLNIIQKCITTIFKSDEDNNL